MGAGEAGVASTDSAGAGDSGAIDSGGEVG